MTPKTDILARIESLPDGSPLLAAIGTILQCAVGGAVQAPDRPIIGAEEVAARIDVSLRTVREWTKAGRIPSILLPGSRRRLYCWQTVQASLARHQRGGAA